MDVVEKARIIAKKTCPACAAEFAADDEATHCPHDNMPLASGNKDQDPLVGTLIADRYEILEMIGSGGWALIYKAKQRPLNRLVAIKILHGHLAGDPEKVKRFKREAEAATKLVHENVGSVFDYGLLPEGQPYMVMEYLQGITLQEILKRDGKLDVERSVDLFQQMCSGLALAHVRGIVHRDIKPSNVYMVNNESQAKILDFGLAKLLTPEDSETSTSLTQTGQTIGTPSYMSPEQCTGHPLDARSDLYSLGCVMFETLTGKRAFEGRNLFETMSQQINSDPSFEAAGVAAAIPADLQLVVMKALAKDPQERYQSAKELDAALEQVLTRLKGDGGNIWFAKVKAFIHKQRRRSRRMAREPLVSAVVAMSVVLGLFAGWRLFTDNGYNGPDSQVPADTSYKTHMAQGQTKLDKGKYDAASKLFRQAAKESLAFGEQDQRHVTALTKERDSLKLAKREDDALRTDQELERIRQLYTGAMYGDETANAHKIAELEHRFHANPSDRSIAQQLCCLRNNQAQLMLTNSRFEDAENQLKRAIEIEQQCLGTNTAEYATTLSNLGYVYSQNNENAQAEAAYKTALDLRQSLFGTMDPLYAKSLRNLGDFYLRHGDYKKAQMLLEKSLAVYKKVGTEADVAWDLNNLGAAYLQEKQYGRAEILLEQSLQLRKQISKDNPDYIDIGRTEHNLGSLKRAIGDLRGARQMYEDALQIYETQLSPTHADTLKCAWDLASVYMQQQDFKLAIPPLKRIISSVDPSDPMAKAASDALRKAQGEAAAH